MKRSFIPYDWPEALYPLREWMRRKGVDVDALKSERQAFWMARTLGRQKVKFTNDRTKSLFPYMMKLQKTLCPNAGGGRATHRREPFVPGTFGAASEVRRIDPSSYSPSPQTVQPLATIPAGTGQPVADLPAGHQSERAVA